MTTFHRLGLLTLALVTLVGCTPDTPGQRAKDEARRSAFKAEPAVAEAPPPIEYLPADIELSPTARAHLADLIGQDLDTRVRLEFTPEGCTGMKTHLALDTGVPEPTRDRISRLEGIVFGSAWIDATADH